MAKLTKAEERELVRLMNKLSFPVPLIIFEAWCRVFGTITTEVALIRHEGGDPQVLLSYREDKFFRGWHIPGCVHLPIERLEDTLRRVITEEIGLPASAKTEFFSWHERPQGNGEGQSPRGHELSLLFTCHESHAVEETPTMKFFSLESLPEGLLRLHVPILINLSRTENLQK